VNWMVILNIMATMVISAPFPEIESSPFSFISCYWTSLTVFTWCAFRKEPKYLSQYSDYRNRKPILGRAKIFFFSLPRPAQPFVCWTSGLFDLRVQRPGREAGHSSLSSAEL
jgi:hypothetical protein